MMKVTKEFYRRADTSGVAKDLLGKILCVQQAEGFCSGRIVETEAYVGIEDRGCHAYGGKRTPRNETMYADGGVCYIYICYGIHQMFNVVTNSENQPHAVLIRALQPLEGLPLIKERRPGQALENLARGPGLVGQAMGFHVTQNGTSLLGEQFWIEDDDNFDTGSIIESPRVGMNFEGYYKTVPWRFRIGASAYTSRAK